MVRQTWQILVNKGSVLPVFHFVDHDTFPQRNTVRAIIWASTGAVRKRKTRVSVSLSLDESPKARTLNNAARTMPATPRVMLLMVACIREKTSFSRNRPKAPSARRIIQPVKSH